MTLEKHGQMHRTLSRLRGAANRLIKSYRTVQLYRAVIQEPRLLSYDMELGLQVLIISECTSMPILIESENKARSEVGAVQTAIMTKLQESLKPSHLEVINESNMHNVPKGAETHFKVVVVSDSFQGMPLIKRHRVVMDTLKAEMEGPVHALSIQAKTPEQWEKCDGQIAPSPPCLGGSKR